MDRGLLVKKIIKRKKGQDYLVWDENAFILPRIGDKPFTAQDRFGTILYFQLENALCLQKYELPGEIQKEISILEECLIDQKALCGDFKIIIKKGTEKMSKMINKEFSKTEKIFKKKKEKILKLESEYQFIKKTGFEEQDNLITAINPTVMKTLLEETSLTKVLAQEKEWWEAFKYPILIGVIGFLAVYMITILEKIL